MFDLSIQSKTVKNKTKLRVVQTVMYELLLPVSCHVLFKCCFQVESFITFDTGKIVFSSMFRHVILQPGLSRKSFATIFTPILLTPVGPDVFFVVFLLIVSFLANVAIPSTISGM